jgi:uncharacterized protein (DUF305 family)
VAPRCALPLLLVLPLVLAGCGGGDDGLFGASGVAGGEPNATDARFAREMLANDRQVGALAGLARERALRKELRRLARSTLERQAKELPELTAAADAVARRGVRAPGPAPATPGVDARKLRVAVSFDHEFMVMMIRVHEDAVAAAELEQDRGGDARLRRLAGEIHESRSRDLEWLRRWLHTWYGEDTLPGEQAPDPSGPGGGEPQV